MHFLFQQPSSGRIGTAYGLLRMVDSLIDGKIAVFFLLKFFMLVYGHLRLMVKSPFTFRHIPAVWDTCYGNARDLLSAD